jgi:putative FmdB family regulatory protein
VPIYEYLCEACGNLTERMQKMSDPPPQKCPECGSRKIARMMSRTSFQLRGGGWYADLYSSPRKDGAKAEAAAPGAPATGAEVAAAEAPAPKAEAPADPPGSGPGQGSAPRARPPGRKSARRRR